MRLEPPGASSPAIFVARPSGTLVREAALLVFLPATARAGIVAADLRRGALVRHPRRMVMMTMMMVIVPATTIVAVIMVV
jgi:hypothetical protein